MSFVMLLRGILRWPFDFKRFLPTSQEIVIEDIPSLPKDMPPEKLIDPDSNLDGLEEVEVAEPTQKTESQVSYLLEKLMSYSYEELDGGGALKILQKQLNIKPLDMEKLNGSTDLPDSMLKNIIKKPCTEQVLENPANPVSSPTPPRTPFTSISSLRKKIKQSNPLRDPFCPDRIDLCAHPKEKLLGQVDTLKELDMSNELELHTEPLLSDMNPWKVMEDADGLPEQSRSENASMERDKLVGQVNVHLDSGMFGEMELNAEINTTKHPFCQLEINAGALSDHFEDINASIPNMDANSTQNEERGNSMEEAMRANYNESNPSVVDEEARDVASTRRQTDKEQKKLHAAKQRRGKRVAGVKRTRDASTRRQTDPAEQQELHVTTQERGKKVAVIRDAIAHPMRKSLSEARTSIETGGRRSSRVRTRPLEYWKGERFLYGRDGDSLNMIGLKYISPEKGNEKLKVKPYEELLHPASRH